VGGPAGEVSGFVRVRGEEREPVALRFYFDLMRQTPLVLLLLAFFAAGEYSGCRV